MNMPKKNGDDTEKSMESKKVVCIGSLNVDVMIYTDNFCEDDDEQIIKKTEIFSGGQAGNIADGLGKLGKNAYFFGNIGRDSHTEMLKQDFDNSNVNYSYAKSTDKQNNSVYCIVDKSGQRRIYAYNNIDFDADDFDAELYENTEFIIFTSIIKDDAIEIYSEIAKRAKAKGIKIVLDPGAIFANLKFEKLKPLLQYCDYIFPSERELKIILEDSNMKALLEMVPHVIVTCGKDGMIYHSRSIEPKKFPIANLDINIVDSVGAGDCVVASFISALMDGASTYDAIKYSLVASRMSVGSNGARCMPDADAISRNLEKCFNHYP